MPNPTESPTPRRAVLLSLLFAACTGCGGEGVTMNATKDGKKQGQQTAVLAPKTARVPGLEGSGMRSKMISDIRGLVSRPHGVFLCCSPTGSGRMTTLYACLAEVDARKKKIITVEDPIERRLDDVTQIEVNTKAGETFATSLRSVIRQDPAVIMIGEIRDQETASIAFQAAHTGRMVFLTVHSLGSIEALYRLLDLGVEPSTIASSLTGVLGQRPLRLLCDSCKEPYRPQPEFLRKVNIPAGTVDVFYRRPQNPQRVCPRCNGTGYASQTGIFELLIVTEQIREIMRNSFSFNAIKAEARKSGMTNLMEDGLRQVVSGRTSIEGLLEAMKLE